MKQSNLFYCALLFTPCTLTDATPLLNSQSSALLSLVNTTASFPALNNITLPHATSRVSVGPPFTPGLEPSEEVFFYDVPFSNPPVNIKFKDYDLQLDRNETDVDKCFQKAMMACSDREKHFTEMEAYKLVRWDSGDVLIEIEPKRGDTSTLHGVVNSALKNLIRKWLISRFTIDPDQAQGLTYGIFTDVLQGLNNFRLFYPHLNFFYEVYVYPGEEEDENYVGIGQLSPWE
ncbi:MAG: hypothetical protein ASARMPRED_002860 [Alectoria sarmentosa]|nr:MAG: hypothetical protein ASARMPRED_002860 [Alectoria sarmentosa]